MNYFAIPGLIREDDDSVKLRLIQKVVCHAFGITNEQVGQRTNKRNIVLPRQIIYYFTRQKTQMTLKEIGAIYNKDHSVVAHSITAIRNLIKTDSDFNLIIQEIGVKINS